MQEVSIICTAELVVLINCITFPSKIFTYTISPFFQTQICVSLIFVNKYFSNIGSQCMSVNQYLHGYTMSLVDSKFKICYASLWPA